ncbi:hypothetical protein BV921_00030 [Pectobacterium odoriferum]|nr:hypothetical protein BV925_03150 [Pectobacterium odoriferum]POE12917.1 hypothetical protein BV921_00030 [Pectobacterium odoriferum]
MAFLFLYTSYFTLHVRWLRSLTRITYLSKLIGVPSLAACLKRELFSVYHYKKQKTAIARLQRLYCSMYITPITSLTVMDDAGGDNAYQSV